MTKVNVNFRIDKNLKNEFYAIAEENAQVPSLLIRKWIEEYVEKYEEENKMEKIKGIINGVLEGKLELDNEFGPDFHEQPFTGGADEIYIGHFVEGFEGDDAIMLYFPEKEHIIEARNNNWVGDLSDEELDEMLENVNDYEDRFDYNKVAAYTDELGLNWL